MGFVWMGVVRVVVLNGYACFVIVLWVHGESSLQHWSLDTSSWYGLFLSTIVVVVVVILVMGTGATLGYFV